MRQPARTWYPTAKAYKALEVGSQLEQALVTQCKQAGLPAPILQHQIVTGRKWRYDLAWIPAMLAVEVQGGIWTDGAHTRGAGISRDCLKISTAVAQGWRIMPISASMIDDGIAIQLIEKALGQW